MTRHGVRQGAVSRARGRLAILVSVVVAALVVPPGAMGNEHRVVVEEGQVLAAVVHHFDAAGPTHEARQVPLLEIFTATWCPPCAPADRAVERLLAEATNTSRDAPPLAVLSYHPWPDPGVEDPFGVPEGMSRMQRKHGATWFPSAYVAGVLEDEPRTRSMAVDAGLEQVLYDSYRSLLRRAEAIGPVFVTTLETTTQGRNVTVSAHLEAQADVPAALYVQPVIWEDRVFFPGGNGIDEHRFVVRDLLARERIPDGVVAGSSWTGTWAGVVPAEVDLDAAGVTLVIEVAWTHGGAEVAPRLMQAVIGAAMVTGSFVAVAYWVVHRRPGDP